MNFVKIIDVVLMIFKLVNSQEFKAVANKIIEFLRSLEEAKPESVQEVRKFRASMEKIVKAVDTANDSMNTP